MIETSLLLINQISQICSLLSTALSLLITLLSLLTIIGSVLDLAKQTLITVISMENVTMTLTKGLSVGKQKKSASLRSLNMSFNLARNVN